MCEEGKERSQSLGSWLWNECQVARNLGLLAQELGISVRTLYRWKDLQLGRVKKVREPVPREKRLEAEIQRLKQSLADRALEIDFFKGVG